MSNSSSMSALLLAGALAATPAAASVVDLDVGLAHPVLQADRKQTTYVRIGLTGRRGDANGRAPANVALVIDRSGSMTGQKIARATEAALAAIRSLDERDIVSVIAYDSTVEVLVPATRMTDRAAVERAIKRLRAGGNTALFGGVSKGAAELRKFMAADRISRLVLLSDGRANVGPSSPSDLGDLGASLKRAGISVSTMGLGLDYNEDLMTRLAARSDGNHVFIEDATALAESFQAEFGEILTAAATDLDIRITCAPGVRPVRVLGREAAIHGRTVMASLGQVYSDQQKHLLLEIEIPAGEAGSTQEVVQVDLTYTDLVTGQKESRRQVQHASFSVSAAEVENSIDRGVMVSSVLALATERNELATSLRDAGKVKEAHDVLRENTDYLEQNAARYDSSELGAYGASNEMDMEGLDEKTWRARRKDMRAKQHSNYQQQKVEPVPKKSKRE